MISELERAHRVQLFIRALIWTLALICLGTLLPSCRTIKHAPADATLLGGTGASDTINIQLRPMTTVTVCKIRLQSTVSVRAYESSGADVRVWAFMERWTY